MPVPRAPSTEFRAHGSSQLVGEIVAWTVGLLRAQVQSQRVVLTPDLGLQGQRREAESDAESNAKQDVHDMSSFGVGGFSFNAFASIIHAQRTGSLLLL